MGIINIVKIMKPSEILKKAKKFPIGTTRTWTTGRFKKEAERKWKPLPVKGTPDWHKLKGAKDTMKMNPVMAAVAGGPSVDEAKATLAEYGLVEAPGVKYGKKKSKGLFPMEEAFLLSAYRTLSFDIYGGSNPSDLNIVRGLEKKGMVQLFEETDSRARERGVSHTMRVTDKGREALGLPEREPYPMVESPESEYSRKVEASALNIKHWFKERGVPGMRVRSLRGAKADTQFEWIQAWTPGDAIIPNEIRKEVVENVSHFKNAPISDMNDISYGNIRNNGISLLRGEWEELFNAGAPKQVSSPESGYGTGIVKNYNIQHNIGHAKYVVNFHDGQQTHSDGSPFYGIKIFKNKKDLNSFVGSLSQQGYVYTRSSMKSLSAHKLVFGKSVPASTYSHPDKLGEGSKKRKKLKKKGDKFEAVMREFKHGTLRSSSGQKVTDVQQAKAIAASEAGISKKKK